MQIINNDIIEVIADYGKILISKDDPECTAHHLWLGIYDSPDNWEEIDDNSDYWQKVTI